MKNLASIMRALHGIDDETPAWHRAYMAEGVSDKVLPLFDLEVDQG